MEQPKEWVLVNQESFIFVEWGKVLLLSLLLGMMFRGYAQALGTVNDKEGALSVILNPMSILTTATNSVVERTDQLFGGVIRVGNELTRSVSIIRDSIQNVAQLLRTLFTIITAFVIRFTKILQGIMGSLLGSFQNMKQILNGLMETAGVIIYTAETGVNLSQSVMNGPPGKAMRTMADLINALS
jgi:signal transduction histidine kinase